MRRCKNPGCPCRPNGRRRRNGDFDNDADELVLTTVNDGRLYESIARPILTSLTRKMVAGKYDPNAAVRAWLPLAEAGARAYARDFPGTRFDKATKQAAAVAFEEHYREEAEHAARRTNGRKRRNLPSASPPGGWMSNPRRARFTVKKQSGGYGVFENGREVWISESKDDALVYAAAYEKEIAYPGDELSPDQWAAATQRRKNPRRRKATLLQIAPPGQLFPSGVRPHYNEIECPACAGAGYADGRARPPGVDVGALWCPVCKGAGSYHVERRKNTHLALGTRVKFTTSGKCAVIAKRLPKDRYVVLVDGKGYETVRGRDLRRA